MAGHESRRHRLSVALDGRRLFQKALNASGLGHGGERDGSAESPERLARMRGGAGPPQLMRSPSTLSRLPRSWMLSIGHDETIQRELWVSPSLAATWRPGSGRSTLRVALIGEAGSGAGELWPAMVGEGRPVAAMIVAGRGVQVAPIEAAQMDEHVRPHVYPSADVLVLVFALGDWRSLEAVVVDWLPEARAANPTAEVVLVATQGELRAQPEQRGTIGFAEARETAKEIGAALYRECSLAWPDSVYDAWEDIVRVGTGEYEAPSENVWGLEGVPEETASSAGGSSVRSDDEQHPWAAAAAGRRRSQTAPDGPEGQGGGGGGGGGRPRAASEASSEGRGRPRRRDQMKEKCAQQ